MNRPYRLVSIVAFTLATIAPICSAGPAPPTISSIQGGGPKFPTAGGLTVTIIGSNFADPAQVLVDGQFATDVVVANDGVILFTLPPGNPGASSVNVLCSGLASLPGVLGYEDPTISSVSPDSGSAAGGDVVTVFGNNFGLASAIRTWLFGGRPGSEVEWLGHGSVRVAIPPNTVGSPIDVAVLFGPYLPLPGGFRYFDAVTAVTKDLPPVVFELLQNQPNPSRGRTMIRVGFARATKFRLSIFDISGRLVSRLEDFAPVGVRTVAWDGTDSGGAPAPSGVYVYRLEAGSFSGERRLTLTR